MNNQKCQAGTCEHNAYSIELKALRKELAELKDSQNKVKADAIRDAKEYGVFSHDQGLGTFDDGFTAALYHYDEYLEKYANTIEVGQ